MPYESDPAASTSDELRFLVGDTDVDREMLTDEEVDYLLGKHGTPLQGAYHGALSLAAKYGAKASVSVGSARLDYDTIANRFGEVAKSLAARGGDAGIASTKVGPPYAGGLASEDNPLEMAAIDWHNYGSTTEDESA